MRRNVAIKIILFSSYKIKQLIKTDERRHTILALICFYMISMNLIILLFYCLKCLVKVLNNIVNILCSNRKADCIRLNPLIQKLFFRTLTVSCRRRVDNQRFHIRNICQQ